MQAGRKFPYFMLRTPFPAKAQDTEVRVFLKGAEDMELNAEGSDRHLKPSQRSKSGLLIAKFELKECWVW